MFGQFLNPQKLAMVALLASVLPCTAWGQSLGQIRSDVRGGENHEPEHDHKEHKRDWRKHSDPHQHADPWFNEYHHHDHPHDDHCEDDDDDVSWGHFYLAAATSPFWLPRAMLGDDSFDAATFARYPYLHGIDGYMSTKHQRAADEYPWLLRLRAEYLSDLNNLSRLGGQVLFDTSTRFGIDSEFNYHTENLGSGMRDHLWTGDANIVFRFAQSRKVQMRTGVGLNWLSDTVGGESGF